MNNTAKIEKAARLAGLDIYRDAYMSTEKALAQRQLAGRTHYCDDHTLRFFGARINDTRQDANGLWFALRESVQPPHSGRVHRWAIFDIFGHCERTEGRSTGAAADKLLPALIASKDWHAHTIAGLLARADEQQRNADEIRTILGA